MFFFCLGSWFWFWFGERLEFFLFFFSGSFEFSFVVIRARACVFLGGGERGGVDCTLLVGAFLGGDGRGGRGGVICSSGAAESWLGFAVRLYLVLSGGAGV